MFSCSSKQTNIFFLKTGSTSRADEDEDKDEDTSAKAEAAGANRRGEYVWSYGVVGYHFRL